MAVSVPRDALDLASAAVHEAIQRCRDLDGMEVETPFLSDDDLSFAILGAMTMLLKDEVLLDDMLIVHQEFPRCRAASHRK